MYYACYSHNNKDCWQVHLFEDSKSRDSYVKSHEGFTTISRDKARKIGIPKKDKAIKYGWYH
jgi:hypothetical protein